MMSEITIEKAAEVKAQEVASKEKIPQADTIRYIKPDTAKFAETPGGFLSLSIDPDEEYKRVNLHRSFPHKEESRYISVRNTEGKEIGLIESINDFPPETVKIMEKELDRRYFVPVINRIISMKEEFGYTYWEVETDSGPRRFTVQGGHNSVLSISECRLLVIDMDGNRFEIPDYFKLDSKSLKLVEPMI